MACHQPNVSLMVLLFVHLKTFFFLHATASQLLNTQIPVVHWKEKFIPIPSYMNFSQFTGLILPMDPESKSPMRQRFGTFNEGQFCQHTLIGVQFGHPLNAVKQDWVFQGFSYTLLCIHTFELLDSLSRKWGSLRCDSLLYREITMQYFTCHVFSERYDQEFSNSLKEEGWGGRRPI